MITSETIITDISEALNTTDLVPDGNHNGRDYLSYRYRWNDTRPIVLIRVYGEQHYEVVTGKKCYGITDDEIYGALKPLIIKKVKAVYDAACAEIAYRDDEMSVIMHGDDTRELWMFVDKGDEKYSATYYAKSGRISLGMVPREFTARYMELVKEYFLPFVEKHRGGQMTDEILDWADKERKATEKAFRMVERWRRIVAAYTALIAFLLGVLVGILGYTGYVAYTAPERGGTAVMEAE